MNKRNEIFPESEKMTTDEDRILILTADHASRTVPIPKTGLTVGSKPDNTIVLNDPQVAGYHVRVEAENGHYRVIDLNSITGTFLGDLRLHPGAPAEWISEQALRIGENWLGLKLAKETAEPAEESEKPALPEFDPQLIQWSDGEKVGIYIAVSQLSLYPGKSADIGMVVFNAGPAEDHVRLTAGGVPANWVHALPAVVAVPAASQQEINLHIQLPQAPLARVGRHVITLQVASQNRAEEKIETTISLTVLAFSRFNSTLSQEPALDKPARLKIENLGNLPETFVISTQDPSGKLKFQLSDEQVKIAEGEAAVVELYVTPPVTLLSRTEPVFPFSVQVRSASGQIQTHKASLAGQALFPIWLLPVLLVSMLCMSGVLLAALFGLARAGAPAPETRTPTPTMTVTSLLTDTDLDGLSDADEIRMGTNPRSADTDSDSLRDGDEVRAGSNPLVIDSDGDTLSDGMEVLVMHTSPVNPDTDGDGLYDNVDPAPGELPTPTPIIPTATEPPSATLPPTAIPPTATPPPPTNTPIPPSPTVPPPTPAPTTASPPTPTTAPPTVTQPPPVIVHGTIAFETGRNGNLEIYLYQASTQSELRLTNNATDDRHLAWSSLNQLAFDTDRDGNSEIYVMNADGSAQTRLTDNPARDFNPSWSPDGRSLTFITNRDGNDEIYAMSADGSNAIRLTNTPAAECCQLFSPQGNLIVFMSDQTGGWGLYRMNTDGTNQSLLAPASASPPSWAPDGTRLAFVSNRDGNAEIYTINSNGGGETRLTNNSAQDTNPVWSPDGSRIMFLSNRDGNFEIYTMNPDGSNQSRMTNTAGDECCLVWSPDGAQIAFSTPLDGALEIHVFDIITRGFLRLTSNASYDAPLLWRP